MKTVADFKKRFDKTSLNFEVIVINGVPSKWAKLVGATPKNKKEINIDIKLICKADAKPTDASTIVEREPGTWIIQNTYTVGRKFSV